MTSKKDPLKTKSESLAEAWKLRESYTDGMYGTPFHNSWRAVRFTLRGKKIGHSENWKKFSTFKKEMLPSYQEGYKLCRKDKSRPFSKDNCKWVLPGDLRTSRTILFEYNGEKKTFKEWCLLYELNLTGVMKRYHTGVGYTPDEILFGIKRKPKRELVDAATLGVQKLRMKASKMISSYRCRDNKRDLSGKCDLTIEWLIENILKKSCVYCGTNKKVGVDRLDNKTAHTKDNAVPCCFRCNAVRGDHFTHEQMKKIGVFLRDHIDQ